MRLRTESVGSSYVYGMRMALAADHLLKVGTSVRATHCLSLFTRTIAQAGFVRCTGKRYLYPRGESSRA